MRKFRLICGVLLLFLGSVTAASAQSNMTYQDYEARVQSQAQQKDFEVRAEAARVFARQYEERKALEESRLKLKNTLLVGGIVSCLVIFALSSVRRSKRRLTRSA